MPKSTIIAILASVHLAAAAPCQRAEAADLIAARASDVDGRVHCIGCDDGTSPVVLVFLDPGCPVAKRYAPELGELAAKAGAGRVRVYGVISDPSVRPAAARAFRDEFRLTFPVLLDASGDLAARLRPTHVPEAFVVTQDDRLVYRGRIDDRFADLGKLRPEITSHDLADALAAVAAGRDPAHARTTPVGCDFEAWAETAKAPAEVTYTRDVAPILRSHCAECHRPGDIGPFPLLGYEHARRRARMIARVTGRRLMPPWRAEQGFGHFRDERVLSARQIAILDAWAKAGAPEGDPADLLPAPPLPADGWLLGEPDLEITLPEAFQVPAKGDDIYRYFSIPLGLKEDKTVVAVDFRPGDPTVVHHAIAMTDSSSRTRRLDAKDPKPGFSVFGNTNTILQYRGIEGLSGWAPGSPPYELPKDHGIRLKAGVDLLLEVHYHLSGKETKDRSTLALYFAKEPVKHYVDSFVIGTQSVDIPAGEASYWRHVQMRVPAGMRLIDVSPHMHFIGKEVEAVATLPDGTKKQLIRIADWDFRWQNIYMYRAPIHLPRGSRIDAWFRFDNSAQNPANPHSPPERIAWGWQTTEEMCEIYFTYVPDRPRERGRLQWASLASWTKPAAPTAEWLAARKKR